MYMRVHVHATLGVESIIKLLICFHIGILRDYTDSLKMISGRLYIITILV
jgi:hypothetical protein